MKSQYRAAVIGGGVVGAAQVIATAPHGPEGRRMRA